MLCGTCATIFPSIRKLANYSTYIKWHQPSQRWCCPYLTHPAGYPFPFTAPDTGQSKGIHKAAQLPARHAICYDNKHPYLILQLNYCYILTKLPSAATTPCRLVVLLLTEEDKRNFLQGGSCCGAILACATKPLLVGSPYPASLQCAAEKSDGAFSSPHAAPAVVVMVGVSSFSPHSTL